MEKKAASLKPYIVACAVQALPVIVWISAPGVFGDSGASDSFLRLLMWSNAASFIGGMIIGTLRVRKLSQAGKCLAPMLIVAAVAALFRSDSSSEVAIYMISIYVVSQAPAAILGGAFGAYSAGAKAWRKQRG